MRSWTFMHRFFCSLAGAAAVVLACSVALVPTADAVEWRAALGVGSRPDYEGGDDYEAVPLGSLRATVYRHAFIDFAGVQGSGGAPRLRANIVADGFLQLGPVLQYRGGRDGVDDASVDALPEVDPTLEMGIFAGFEEAGWNGSVTFAHDVADEHDGFVIELAAGYSMSLTDTLTIGMEMASTYASGGYMGAFFTVDSTAAGASGLARYDADADFKDVGGSLMIDWMFPDSEHWGLKAVFEYFRMIGDARHSPVVDDAGSPNQLLGGLLISYSS